jgi:hypothetical protein
MNADAGERLLIGAQLRLRAFALIGVACFAQFANNCGNAEMLTGANFARCCVDLCSGGEQGPLKAIINNLLVSEVVERGHSGDADCENQAAEKHKAHK